MGARVVYNDNKKSPNTITITGGAAMAILGGGFGTGIVIVVGLVWAIVIAIFIWLSAFVCSLVLKPFAAKWPVNPSVSQPSLRFGLSVAIFVFMAATTIVDLLLPGSVSFPGMVFEFDKPICDQPGCMPPGRFEPLIDTIGTYYQLNVGKGPFSWIVYALKLIPGTALFAWLFAGFSGYSFERYQDGRQHLALATVITIGLTQFVMQPMVGWLLIMGRNGS